MADSTLANACFNHVVLPHNLPGIEDQNQPAVDRALLSLTTQAAKAIRSAHADVYPEINDLCRSLESTARVHIDGHLDRLSLINALQNLPNCGFLALHIREQNAAVFVHIEPSSVTFEAFETSSLSSSVLASRGVLKRDFPGSAVRISLATLHEDGFCSALADFLSQSSSEPLKNFASRTGKAGKWTIEERETVDPSLITSLLMTILCACGTREKVKTLQKNVRDDVSFAKNSIKPWRRSPFWPALRVSMQRYLYSALGHERGHTYYKFLTSLVLEQLVQRYGDQLEIPQLAQVKVKIARRLSKLELQKTQASGLNQLAYDALFASFGESFRRTLQDMQATITNAWLTFRQANTKRIPVLPRSALEDEMTLQLPNSYQFMYRIMNQFVLEASTQAVSSSLEDPGFRRMRSHAAQEKFLASWLEFAKQEEHARASYEQQEDLVELDSYTPRDLGIECVRLAAEIKALVEGILPCNAEQQSIRLLLIIKLWVILDRLALRAFPLLAQHHTGISEAAFDTLKLGCDDDSKALHFVQNYIDQRNANAEFPEIFRTPVPGCFAERYFDRDETMQTLRDKINADIVLQVQAKTAEWEESSRLYDKLTQEINSSTCLLTATGGFAVPSIHDDRHGTECFKERTRRRMRISPYEDALPLDDNLSAKAMIFEVTCPRAFVAYRDITWAIAHLGQADSSHKGPAPRITAIEFLSSYVNQPSGRTFTLTSSTKPISATHYHSLRFPVNLDEVLRPNGLRLRYYDHKYSSWGGSSSSSLRMSFTHLTTPTIPPTSPFSSILKLDQGLTSNEILATQGRCPKELNVHEFVALQDLISSGRRRWLLLLVALGSTTVNFSSEASNVVVAQLVNEVGPRGTKFRENHSILQDQEFGLSLCTQIERRLGLVTSNWREVLLMDSLLAITTRLCSQPCPLVVRQTAAAILEQIRSLTLGWVRELRILLLSGIQPNTAHTTRLTQYLLWSTILCKRTFNDQTMFSVADLIECCIEQRQLIPADPDKLPQLLRNALISDIKSDHRRANMLKSLLTSSAFLRRAIASVYQLSTDGSGALNHFGAPNEMWISYVDDSHTTVCYHLLHGHVLVNGRSIGVLPQEHGSASIIRNLFGDTTIRTYPSGQERPGMLYGLIVPNANHHEVHVGLQDGHLLVRAWKGGAIYQLIPPNIFQNNTTVDVPQELIRGCFHWLNIRTGTLHVRRPGYPWTDREGDFAVNLQSRKAVRKTSTLIDPNSSLYRKFAAIFAALVHGSELTVYQTQDLRLRVDIRLLDLQFLVAQGKLRLPQTMQEVDPDQDAGCLYGLRSKLVLRDIHDIKSRSVMVPMGRLTPRRHGSFVISDIESSQTVVQYRINTILGRLDCPAEPLMIYTKILLHAVTSFVLPDELTYRTGTEEALYLLRSGVSQPWETMHDVPQAIFMQIGALSPSRSFYPAELRVMQLATGPDLPAHVLHDGFKLLVDRLLFLSKHLSLFGTGNANKPAVLQSPRYNDLVDRALHCRGRFERNSRHQQAMLELSTTSKPFTEASSTFLHPPRDSLNTSVEVLNVAKTFHSWRINLGIPTDLPGLLQSWPLFKGHSEHFAKEDLNSWLSLDPASEFGALLELCRSTSINQKSRMMFLFSAMAYSGKNHQVLGVFCAMALLDRLKAIEPPSVPSYLQYRHRAVPQHHNMVELVKKFVQPLDDNYESLDFGVSHKQLKERSKILFEYETQAIEECHGLARFILDRWPCHSLDCESLPVLSYVRQPEVVNAVNAELLHLFQHHEYSIYIDQLQQDLSTVPPTIEQGRGSLERSTLHVVTEVDYYVTLPAEFFTLPCLHDCLNKPISFETTVSFTEKHPKLGPAKDSPRTQKRASKLASYPNDAKELLAIVNKTEVPGSSVSQQYSTYLRQSLAASVEAMVQPPSNGISQNDGSEAEMLRALANVDAEFETITRLCEHVDCRAPWLILGGLWPVVSPAAVLEELSSKHSNSPVKTAIREQIVHYGILITRLQQWHRMHAARNVGREDLVRQELSNAAHQNWKPSEWNDWLLLEIEGNFLIRPEQVDVALATMSPQSGSNSVLQMNMGSGKTSVVMNMVSAGLADGKMLVRLIVPRALLLQTAQIISSRLGGLLGRSVCHVPFNRRTDTTRGTAKTFLSLHKDVMTGGGVMITLPEHLLSFKLSGVQRLLNQRTDEAQDLFKIQKWLDARCRDILDESDVTLSVKTQLVYPSGSLYSIDGSPYRWEVIQSLLSLVRDHIWHLQEEYPKSVQIIKRAYPIIFFLSRDIEIELFNCLASDVCHTDSTILPLSDASQEQRDAIRQFITQAKPGKTEIEIVSQYKRNQPVVKKKLLLLRGLLAHRNLFTCLKKRWNVSYGLHPLRDPIAVPYLSKGTPSEQAEFGHPDVSLTLTCLSFYFTGLSLEQFQQVLLHILNSDNSAPIYEAQVAGVDNVPDSSRDWTVINIEDLRQISILYEILKLRTSTIDYYLNHLVFPRHAKQFATKIQCSGWDVSQQPVSVRTSSPLTTGFSGTNDNRNMLPLNIRQADIPALLGTNASVLRLFLEPRNRSCVLASKANGERFTEIGLLSCLKKSGIRILIDAGAVILEMSNLDLIHEWMKIDPGAKAGVYFNQDHKPFVEYRNGKKLPLIASPFVDNMSECIVYLDEAHTRGTDLKLPTNGTGALTLGKDQSKDHTVHAAMRLRQLATTQNTKFFVPPEVHHSILDVCRKSRDENVDSADVICWLISNTINSLQQMQPMFYAQGVDYCRRRQAILDSPDFAHDSNHREVFLEAVCGTEQLTLERLYGTSRKAVVRPSIGTDSQGRTTQIGEYMQNLNERRATFQDFTGDAVHASALEEVEQEREVEVEVTLEVEAEQQVQRPIVYSALRVASSLDRDVTGFVRTGKLSPLTGFLQVFSSLRRTGIGKKYGISDEACKVRVFASNEFNRTISAPTDKSLDHCMRHVNSVLWGTVSETAVLVSPEEAELLSRVCAEQTLPARVHLCLYEAPVARSMLHFNGLSYFSLPALPADWRAPVWLRVSLGVFAGRVHFDHDEYEALMVFFGQRKKRAGELEPGMSQCPLALTKRPLAFLQEWLSLRRKGQDFSNTPMGFICRSKVLTANHPFFQQQDGQDGQKVKQAGVDEAKEGSATSD